MTFIPICGFVSRHAPSPEQRIDLASYHIIQVNPPGRIEPKLSWTDTVLACNCAPDLVVLVLPKEWLTPYVKHAKKLSPRTRIIRPAIVQFDGERYEYQGWVEFVLWKDGTRRIPWIPENAPIEGRNA